MLRHDVTKRYLSRIFSQFRIVQVCALALDIFSGFVFRFTKAQFGEYVGQIFTDPQYLLISILRFHFLRQCLINFIEFLRTLGLQYHLYDTLSSSSLILINSSLTFRQPPSHEVTLSASNFCANLFQGFYFCYFIMDSIRVLLYRVNIRSSFQISSSGVLNKQSQTVLTEVLVELRNRALPSLFPNFQPVLVKSSGIVSPNPSSLPFDILRVRSQPLVIFPHWSLPPNCSTHPQSLLSRQKSYDCKMEQENSVQEIPASESSRLATSSLPSMLLILSTLPTSRKYVSTFISLQKLQLFMKRGCRGGLLGVGDRLYSVLFLVRSWVILSYIWVIYCWIDYRLALTLYSASRSRYYFLPLGSPINPVAPPNKKIGLKPTSLCSLAIIIMDTKLPKCKESAVGSQPQYTLKIRSPSSFAFYF